MLKKDVRIVFCHISKAFDKVWHQGLLYKLEALRERRPPWPRQIITLILPTVKMMSLGCERLDLPTP